MAVRTEHVKVVEYAEVRSCLSADLEQQRRYEWRLRGGYLWGLPGRTQWAEIVGASVIAGVEPRTITGWLAKGGPAGRPFPSPHRFLDRLYWELDTVQDWCAWYHAERPRRRGVVSYPTSHVWPVDRPEVTEMLAQDWAANPQRLSWRLWHQMGWLWGLYLLDGRTRGWYSETNWVDVVGASVIAGVAPRTITGWLAKGGPAEKPFPAAHRFLYRLYWPMDVVAAWSRARR